MAYKTNAIRLLDKQKIEYTLHDYTDTDAISGTEIVAVLNEDPKKVFKTLVTVGKSGEHYVFMVPVEKELDLKKGSKVAGEKSIAMIKQKELLPLTGYIHGGCSPVGMKKQFKTVIHESAKEQETICVSAGHRGNQIEVSVSELASLVRATFSDIIV